MFRLLAVSGIAFASVISPGLGLLACGYLALTVSYSMWLRRVVVLDIPLLKEETRDQFGIAAVIVVDVAVEVAVSRLLASRGMAEADAKARIAAQMGRSERCAMADMVVDNSGSRADLESSVARVWAWLEDLRSASRVGPVRS